MTRPRPTAKPVEAPIPGHRPPKSFRFTDWASL